VSRAGARDASATREAACPPATRREQCRGTSAAEFDRRLVREVELPGPTGEDAVDVLDGDVVLRPEALLHGDAELIGLRAQPKGALQHLGRHLWSKWP